MTFLTFSQFQNSIIDFTTYLNSLIFDFSRDGLDKYYVRSTTEDGYNLHDDIILPWLKVDGALPIAIVAGYGMGKTTYSRFLASELAARALDDPSLRIPILIPLGGITSQQNIRSIISFLFADQHSVPGYTYNTFEVLNHSGRFLIIFDAFDEMKHAMNLNDVKHNLEDIKTLVTAKTKAILIGRPDPFLSDDELKLLKGRESV